MAKYGSYYDPEFGAWVAVPKPTWRMRLRVWYAMNQLRRAVRLPRED